MTTAIAPRPRDYPPVPPLDEPGPKEPVKPHATMLAGVSVVWNQPRPISPQVHAVEAAFRTPGNHWPPTNHGFFAARETNLLRGKPVLEHSWSIEPGQAPTREQATDLRVLRRSILSSGLRDLPIHPPDDTAAGEDAVTVVLTYKKRGVDDAPPGSPDAAALTLPYWAPSLRDAPQAIRDVVDAASLLAARIKPEAVKTTRYPWQQPPA